MTTLFTNPDAWSGGSVDALMFFGHVANATVVEITRAIWSYAQLDGPYLDRNSEPRFQKQFNFAKYGNEGFESLVGILKTWDGHDVPFNQSTIVDEQGLWVYAGPTVGGLPPLWDIGAYPFDDGKPTPWLPPLVQQLCELSYHVHQHQPIVAATYGWLTVRDVDIVMDAIGGKIPDERWAGICVWRGNESSYFPANRPDPLSR